jgi:hypothetical protein
MPRGTLTHEMKTLMILVAHGFRCNVTNCLKKIRGISGRIWNILQYFKIVNYLFHDSPRNPVECFAEPCLENYCIEE